MGGASTDGLPKKRTISDDLSLIRGRLTPFGFVMVVLIYGFPAGISTALGAKGSADSVATFIQVLLFTFPLTTGTAIFIIGLAVLADSSSTSPGPGYLLLAVVALVTALLASAASGVPFDSFLPKNASGLTYIPAFLVSVLAALWSAYGPIAFICGVLAGVALVWAAYGWIMARAETLGTAPEAAVPASKSKPR